MWYKPDIEDYIIWFHLYEIPEKTKVQWPSFSDYQEAETKQEKEKFVPTGQRELFLEKKTFCIFIVVVVIWMHTLVNMHHNLPLKLINLVDCKLYLMRLTRNSYKMTKNISFWNFWRITMTVNSVFKRENISIDSYQSKRINEKIEENKYSNKPCTRFYFKNVYNWLAKMCVCW